VTTNKDFFLRWLQTEFVRLIDDGGPGGAWEWFRAVESDPCCPPEDALNWTKGLLVEPISMVDTASPWPVPKTNAERFYEEIAARIESLLDADGLPAEEQAIADWFKKKPANDAGDLNDPRPVLGWVSDNLPRCGIVTRITPTYSVEPQEIESNTLLVSLGGNTGTFPMRSQEGELFRILMARDAISTIRNRQVQLKLRAALNEALVTIAAASKPPTPGGQGKGHGGGLPASDGTAKVSEVQVMRPAVPNRSATVKR
jgi:hypothetical protein